MSINSLQFQPKKQETFGYIWDYSNLICIRIINWIIACFWIYAEYMIRELFLIIKTMISIAIMLPLCLIADIYGDSKIKDDIILFYVAIQDFVMIFKVDQ
jgi:hypothetical protein